MMVKEMTKALAAAARKSAVAAAEEKARRVEVNAQRLVGQLAAATKMLQQPAEGGGDGDFEGDGG